MHVRSGDVFQLGQNRLACGDATSPQLVERLMAAKSAKLCMTSPPYDNQRTYGQDKAIDWTPLMKGVCSCLPMAPRGQVLVNLGLVHRKGEFVEYWREWLDWMRSVGWRPFGWYVWDKLSAMPGDWNGRLAPAHEFVFHFNRLARKPNKTKPCKSAGVMKNHSRCLRVKDGSFRRFSHQGRRVQPFKIPDSVIRLPSAKTTGKIERAHPAVFPIALPSEFILAFTNRGEIVYEPFAGSGTTLIASQRLGRRCYAVEQNPDYCRLILERWQAEFKTKPTRLPRQR